MDITFSHARVRAHVCARTRVCAHTTQHKNARPVLLGLVLAPTASGARARLRVECTTEGQRWDTGPSG